MNQAIKAEKTVTINRPVEELYRFWRQFQNLPHFMKHLKEVQVYDSTRSHWVTSGPLDSRVEWDAVITDEQENQMIAWRSVEGADVDHAGSIHFKPVSHNRGTEVKVITHYNPPAGGLGAAVAKLFGESPEQQLGDDLHRFKMLMETGEIATTDGQSRGDG
jgi:uncharacterized membrane protein